MVSTYPDANVSTGGITDFFAFGDRRFSSGFLVYSNRQDKFNVKLAPVGTKSTLEFCRAVVEAVFGRDSCHFVPGRYPISPGNRAHVGMCRAQKIVETARGLAYKLPEFPTMNGWPPDVAVLLPVNASQWAGGPSRRQAGRVPAFIDNAIQPPAHRRRWTVYRQPRKGLGYPNL